MPKKPEILLQKRNIIQIDINLDPGLGHQFHA